VWDGPILATVEDAQWMDEASADVLRAVAGRLHERPWVICITRREQDPSPAEDAPRTTLVLEPLDAAATEALATAATDASPLSAHDMALIVERSAGNPLFLQELVVAAQEAGGVESLPGSVESLMTARIDRLPTELREVLREVSVLGYSFPRDLAAAVLTSGEPELLEELSEFLSDEGDVIRFRHAMSRDAAYGGLAYRRRHQLHAVAGDTIATHGNDRPELLSFHYHLAGRYEDAWEASVRAGEAATAVYANTEAARFYERAMDAGRRIRDLDPLALAKVSEALGDARWWMGEYERAGNAYRGASRVVRDDPVAWAGLMLKDARVKARLKWYSQALSTLTRGLKRLEGRDEPRLRAQRAHLMVFYGRLRLERGQFQDAIGWGTRAVEDAEAAGDHAALAGAFRLLDLAYVDVGRPELATYSRRALALYEQMGDLTGQAQVLSNLGSFAYFAGDWIEARANYERSIALAEQLGDVMEAALVRNNVAEILADQGHWEEAYRLFRDSERVLRAAGFLPAIAYVRSNVGRTAARSGRFDEAEALLEEARQGSQEAGATPQVIEAEARLAELQVLRGRPGAALALLEDAFKRSDTSEATPPQAPLLYRVKGYALLQQGDYEAARSALERSRIAAGSRGVDYERALAERALCDLDMAMAATPDPVLAASYRETLDALGVERLPQIPLGSTASTA
jgi:tetratricopeptide (TPR) repeat protein